MPIGQIGKYERLEILGHGASGIVYLAWDTLLRRNVALKEIRVAGPELEKVLSEARVLDRLRHPHIIEVHSVDLHEGVILLDMELVRGKNLAEVLRGRLGSPLEPAEAARIVLALLDALAFAHERRILHKDIKPANILIGDDGTTIKLTDFGLAEALGTASVADGGGTYPYMAPEDYAEKAASDWRSDLWAVGVVLYELLSGKRPFTVSDTRNPFAWKAAVETEVPPPTGVSEALDSVLEKALAKSKADRFQTAREFAETLKGATEGLPLPTPALPSPAPPPPPTNNDLPDRFVFSDGTVVRTLDELLSGAARNWDESRRALIEGRFARFLRAIGEPYIAELAMELSVRADLGPDRKLREFLERARPEEAIPEAEDAEHTVPFAALKERLSRFERVSDLSPLGGGQAQQPLVPPAEIKIEAVVRGSQESVRWWFVPMLLLVLAPAAAGFGSRNGQLLSGLALTGVSGAMLLLVSIGIRQSLWTRILCLFPVVLGVMAGGVLAAQAIQSSQTPGVLLTVSITALLPLGVLLVQAATAKRLWRLWLTLTIILALLAALTLFNTR
ncbi:serine/threonine-protein kinase [Armatimonas sp.]|uniref:serine/threonine-protein kinase n=1 Tax=Armatimonas sp. TaxID=1872638 RepID=UPI00286CC78B|nr:serine/threonine-protein kinase [Armatimonas sp.]